VVCAVVLRELTAMKASPRSGDGRSGSVAVTGRYPALVA